MYSVVHATTDARRDDGDIGEFQGFPYMNQNDPLTHYGVASHERGCQASPSNTLRVDVF